MATESTPGQHPVAVAVDDGVIAADAVAETHRAREGNYMPHLHPLDHHRILAAVEMIGTQRPFGENSHWDQRIHGYVSETRPLTD